LISLELLNEWFSEATQAIQRHGGMVDKFIGDAVMTLFGVPEPSHQSGASAVQAALDMRKALSTMNRSNQVTVYQVQRKRSF
jgi:adenylate cyclase